MRESPCGHCGVACRVDLLEPAPDGVVVRGPLCPACWDDADASTHGPECDCSTCENVRAAERSHARTREARTRGGLRAGALECLGGGFLAELDDNGGTT